MPRSKYAYASAIVKPQATDWWCSIHLQGSYKSSSNVPSISESATDVPNDVMNCMDVFFVIGVDF